MASRPGFVSELGSLRLAEIEDGIKIYDLVNKTMAENFRINTANDILHLIKTCVLSICQLNEGEHVVGFLALQDFPLIPSICATSWEDYVWTKYKAVELTARNTLFVHLICWSTTYGREIVDNMLRSVFMHDPYLQYIAMVKSIPSNTVLVPGQPRYEMSFRRVQVIERGVPGDKLPTLQIAERNDVCLKLRIRRAVEEDNDDLLPIIERRSRRMRDLYGDYYISELISRHPESERVILVCEHKEVAVGVMCLNTQINFEALEESFELSPFAGLRHLEDKTNIKQSKDGESTLSLLGIQNNVNQVGELSEGFSLPIDGVSEVKSGMIQEELERVDSFTQRIKEKDLSSQVSHLSTKAQLDIMNLLDDDEEELEFDIVNIDTHLLRIPRLLSYEELSKAAMGGVANLSKILDDRRRDSLSFTDDKCVKKDKMKKSLSNAPPGKMPEPPRYSGPPNAFIIELFAMHPDYDERFGFQLLEAAFETFPGRDYCVMCLPSSEPSFPLLEHFTLVTPYNTSGRFVNESLFVAHINSVKGEVSVRFAEEYDMQFLSDILEHAPRKNELLELIESSFSSDVLETYVLASRNQPVGVVVLSPVEDPISLRVQYALEPEPYRAGSDGNILAGVLSPAIEPHSRWYMRDVLRQSPYTQLFWTCRLLAKGDSSPVRNLMSMASHMTPVPPYRHAGKNDKDKNYKESSAPFALWTVDRPMTSLPKIYINRNIVVVGASRTGLSFLETLIMGPTSPYLTFTNITLVSQHGLPTVGECLRAADLCVPRDGRYTDRYLKSVPYYFYMDVVPGIMVKIDRQKKCIYLKGGLVKHYDDLVLTCGQQFQHPDYLKEHLFLKSKKEKTINCDKLPMDNPLYRPDRVSAFTEMPENLMLINSLFDANTGLRKLLRMITDLKESFNGLNEDNKIIVYGDCIDAYSCIAALLELGIAADMITFVEPFPPEDTNALRVNCFNNETVDERVQSSISELGIQVYRRCYYTGWRLSGNRIELLHFMTHTQAITLSCFAFFYYGIKAIDVNSFKAITESGLVYDGGLVVGTGFETNDPSVHGAGTCTKYSRRLYAQAHAQKYFCSEDVGEALAALFLQKLDPFMNSIADLDLCPSEIISRYSSSVLGCKSSVYGSTYSNESRFQLPTCRRWQPVMKFYSPITHSATLPGPLYYLKIRRPGIEIPMAVQMALPLQGHTLQTDKNGNYFRLQLNALHCVVLVTCLSKKPFPSENLAQLFGKHEAFFNKLLVRYQMKQIDDLYEFFSQPWMSAMYQMTFKNLMNDINEQDVGTVYDLLKSTFYLFGDNRPPADSEYGIDAVYSGYGPAANVPEDIPSECGQSAAIRDEALGFWKAVCGERIVVAHLSRYLKQNYATNPQYALPKPE
ncbi:cilia- and flagella-associated protein 61-like [Papilio machaon]|uniref:cilia- and flagella-associated protein 61-like n=1 Tax=Papilio machaon TaxID=76193 RepID=UPI001E6635BC|nr:cilia- and flagella-associated protein 61-like [Papilio machaon]